MTRATSATPPPRDDDEDVVFVSDNFTPTQNQGSPSVSTPSPRKFARRSGPPPRIKEDQNDKNLVKGKKREHGNESEEERRLVSAELQPATTTSDDEKDDKKAGSPSKKVCLTRPSNGSTCGQLTCCNDFPCERSKGL